MNIIKLKDKIMPADQPQAELFNNHLKGKYAYWIQMKYVVSFDHMRHEGYVACEKNIDKLLQKEDGTYPKPYGAPSIVVYDIMDYVDTIETDRINNTVEYRLKNSYSPDDDITIDELKMFRTWLAKELLKMDQTELGEQRNTFFTNTETHTLQYYAAEMFDNTVKVLTEFGKYNASISTVDTSSCGCHGSSLSSLYNTELNACDPVEIYKENVYNKMVDMFSTESFWSRWSPEFINEFKKYIDNIIKCNFQLSQTQWMAEFDDCGCQNKSVQDAGIAILKKLSIALEYIRDGKCSGHKNYINDALYDWASQLYEKMQW